MNGLRPFLIGQRIDRNLMRYHERGIKAQSEMSDNLILIRLILVLVQEILSSGERNLVNIFLHLIRGHTDSVIDELNGLLVRIHANLNLILIILGQNRLSDQLQLLQLRDCVRTVGHQLAKENIMIRIQPLLYNRKYIFRIN